ncbi:MAG: glycosyltransferase family 39 protein [bacterium]
MLNRIIEKKGALILIGIMGAALIWGVLNFDILLNQGGDNGRYIMLGRSILDGKFMREISTFKENLHTQYPPLFPLVLSAIMALFGRENIFMMKIFSMIFYLLSVLFFYKTLKLYLKENVIVLSLTGLFIFCKNIVDWSSLILTESLFILVIILILYSFKMYDSTKSRRHYFLLLLFSTLSVFIRGNGFLVFIPMTLYFIIKREWKNLLIMFGFALLSQIWSFYIYLSTGEGSVYFRQVLYKNWYLPHLGMIDKAAFAQRLLINTVNYFTTIIPKTFCVYIAPELKYVAVLIVYIVSLIWGAVVFIKRRMYFEPVWFFVNMCMLLFWPENFTTDRFFSPFIALLLLFVGVAISIYKKVDIIYYLSVGFIFISIFLNIYTVSKEIPSRVYMLGETDLNFRHDNVMRQEIGIRTFFDVAIWAKDSLPEDAVVMSMKPELFYIHSNRKTEIFPYTDTDSLIIEYMKERNIGYVMYENTKNNNRLANLTINKFLLSHEDWFELEYSVYERPYYVLLKLVKQF